jgi:hypothetical protein
MRSATNAQTRTGRGRNLMKFIASPFFLGKQELIRWADSIRRESGLSIDLHRGVVESPLYNTKQKLLLALVLYPVCYFIVLLRYVIGPEILILYCWPHSHPLPYMTPGANLFSKWQAAGHPCGPSSQLQKTFRNIQEYLWIILLFVLSYLIACATMTLSTKKNEQISYFSPPDTFITHFDIDI